MSINISNHWQLDSFVQQLVQANIKVLLYWQLMWRIHRWCRIVSEVAIVVPLWQNTVAEWSAVMSQRLPWLCLCDRTQWLNGQLYCLRGCHGCAFVTEHSGLMVSCIVSEVAMVLHLWQNTVAECSAVLSQRLPWFCLCDINTMAEWSAVLSQRLP